MERPLDAASLTRRLEIREKSRLQGLFLDHLRRVPLGAVLVFRSASALNGVYTHQRWSEDLDFYAPADVSNHFDEIARAQGLPLESRPGMIPVYAARGLLGGRVEIGIDVNDLNANVLPPETRPFVTVAGAPVPVRVQSVAEIMAYKLWCLRRRREAVDFVDLWGAFRQCPGDIGLIADVFARKRARVAAGADPAAVLDVAAVLAGLDGMAGDWGERLLGVMLRPPPIDQVRRELAPLLVPFDGTPFYERSLSFERKNAAPEVP